MQITWPPPEWRGWGSLLALSFGGALLAGLFAVAFFTGGYVAVKWPWPVIGFFLFSLLFHGGDIFFPFTPLKGVLHLLWLVGLVFLMAGVIGIMLTDSAMLLFAWPVWLGGSVVGAILGVWQATYRLPAGFGAWMHPPSLY